MGARPGFWFNRRARVAEREWGKGRAGTGCEQCWNPAEVFTKAGSGEEQDWQSQRRSSKTFKNGTAIKLSGFGHEEFRGG